MKLILAIIILLLSGSINAQTITRQGSNYVASKENLRDTSGKSEIGKPTNFTYTDTKGKVYPIYQSSRGSLYALIVSKKGTTYKKYMPKDSK